MAFKFVVLAAVLAYARAGLLSAPTLAYGAAPALAYSAAPALSYGAAAPVLGSTFHGNLAGSTLAYGSPALAAPAVAYGASALAPAVTSQSSNILRSFGNLGQVSTYSKTIDTPFSSVRKADIRVSNPGLRIAAAAPALAYSAAPALAYGAAPAITTYHGALAGPTLAYGAAAPALAYRTAGPVLGAGLAGPALAYKSAIAAPAIGVAYSAAPAVSHLSYASGYASYGY